MSGEGPVSDAQQTKTPDNSQLDTLNTELDSVQVMSPDGDFVAIDEQITTIDGTPSASTAPVSSPKTSPKASAKVSPKPSASSAADFR